MIRPRLVLFLAVPLLLLLLLLLAGALPRAAAAVAASGGVRVLAFSHEAIHSARAPAANDFLADLLAVAPSFTPPGAGTVRADGSLWMRAADGTLTLPPAAAPPSSTAYLWAEIDGSDTAWGASALADAALELGPGAVFPRVAGGSNEPPARPYLRLARPVLAADSFTVLAAGIFGAPGESSNAGSSRGSSLFFRLAGHGLYPRATLYSDEVGLQFRTNGTTRGVFASLALSVGLVRLVFRYEAASGRAAIFADGARLADVDLGTAGETLDRGSAQPLLGRDTNMGRYLAGSLAEFAAWDRALADAEIAALAAEWAAGRAPALPPALLAVHLLTPNWCEDAPVPGNSSTSVVRDLSGSGNDAVWLNATQALCARRLEVSDPFWGGSRRIVIRADPVSAADFPLNVSWRACGGKATDDNTHVIRRLRLTRNAPAAPLPVLSLLASAPAPNIRATDANGTASAAAAETLLVAWNTNVLADANLSVVVQQQQQERYRGTGAALHSFQVDSPAPPPAAALSVELSATSCAPMAACNISSTGAWGAPAGPNTSISCTFERLCASASRTVPLRAFAQRVGRVGLRAASPTTGEGCTASAGALLGGGAGWPAASGIPLPEDHVWDVDTLLLTEADGRAVAAQFSPLSFWPSGALKWVLLVARVRPGARYLLHYGRAHSFRPANPLSVEVRADSVVVTSDVLRLEMNTTRFAFISRLEALSAAGPPRTLIAPVVPAGIAAAGLVLQNATGARFASGRAADVVVEEAGPVRAVVRVSGALEFEGGGGGMFDSYTFRVTVFASSRDVVTEAALELSSPAGDGVALPPLDTPAPGLPVMQRLRSADLALPFALWADAAVETNLGTFAAAGLDVRQEYATANDTLVGAICAPGGVITPARPAVCSTAGAPDNFTILVHATPTLFPAALIFRAAGDGLYPRARIDAGGRAVLQFRIAGVTRAVSSRRVLAPGQTVWLGFRYDGASGNATVFVDGVEDAVSLLGVGPVDRGTRSTLIGTDTDLGMNFTGAMHALLAFEAALPSTEIASIHAGGAPTLPRSLHYSAAAPPPNGTIFCGARVLDLSGAGNDGRVALASGAAVAFDGAFLFRPPPGASPPPPALVAVDGFWQRYPKALSFNVSAGAGGLLTLGVLPALPVAYAAAFPQADRDRLFFWVDDSFAPPAYRLHQGISVTTRILLSFADDLAETWRARAACFSAPPVLAARPGWYRDTATLGPLALSFAAAPPSSSMTLAASADNALARSLEMHADTTHSESEYSFINYGDWHGERVYNWGNLEYDLCFVQALAFLRFSPTDPETLLQAMHTCRHSADVDTVNFGVASPDGSTYAAGVPAVGAQWIHSFGHTGGYVFSAPSYDSAFTYGYKSVSHMWSRGLFLAGLLRGERRLLASAALVTDFFKVRTAAGFGSWESSERNAGWPLVALAAAFGVSSDPAYLAAAGIVGDAAVWRQDPHKGDWPYWASPDECQEPQYSSWGGKSFMIGILMHGLRLLHFHTGQGVYADTLARAAEYLYAYMYIPPPEGPGYAYIECPHYIDNKLPHSCRQMIDGLTFSYVVSPATVNLSLVLQNWEDYDGFATAFGKSVGASFHSVPSALAALAEILGEAGGCGDLVCENASAGEAAGNCPWDCGSCVVDGVCRAPAESAVSCPEDCLLPVCNYDFLCDAPAENASTCMWDCSAAPSSSARAGVVSSAASQGAGGVLLFC